MPIIERNFNDEVFGKFVWRKVYNFIIKKWIVVSHLSKKIWKPQSYLSNLLNGRRVTKNVEQYREMATAAWMPQEEFNEIVKEARKAEFRQAMGEESNQEMNLSTLEHLDLDDKDLIRVWMKKKFWRTPSEEEIKRWIKLLLAAEEENQ